MKSANNFFIKSIAAGWCIGLGGLINLCLPNKYIGALAFSIGIYMVMCFNMKLVTGFIPVISKNKEFLKLLTRYPLCLLGNTIGASAVAFSVWQQPALLEKANTIILSKTNLYNALLGGIGCGIVIGLIVLNTHKILKWVFAAPLIAVFILTKMEHCVADIFYMIASKNINHIILIYIIIVIIGNLIGGILIGVTAGLKEIE